MTHFHHDGISIEHEETSLLEVQRIMVSAKPTLASKMSPLYQPILERAKKRFWAKVNKTSQTGCWLWTAQTIRGYGAFNDGQRGVRAHRFSYELTHGPIQEGLTLDHLCRNRACVNPDHLEPVTNRENILRGNSGSAINARKMFCIHGHPLFGENLIYQTNGRQCRECKLAYLRKYHERNPRKANRGN